MSKPLTGMPTSVLLALPLVSAGLLGGVVLSGGALTLAVLFFASLAAGLVVFPAAAYAYWRNPQLRSTWQTIGLALLGLQLVIFVVFPYFGGGI